MKMENCSRNGGRGMKENDGGGDSSMCDIYTVRTFANATMYPSTIIIIIIIIIIINDTQKRKKTIARVPHGI
jgi:hypothetical protein